MGLRARLIGAVILLLLVVIGGFGLAAVASHRRVLLAQIDDRIVAALLQPVRERTDRPLEAGDRLLAELILDPAGEVIISLPSGLRGQRDPLPAITGLPQPPLGQYRLITLRGEGVQPAYRVGVRSFREGFRLVVAQPLDDLARAGQALGRRLMLTGAGILAAGAGAVWLIVRKGLRPVDQMIEAATAIAEGDLSRRVETEETETELGRLASALNHMLTNIESAFAAETRANLRLQQFVADASHELRTPLAAIAGYSELHRKGALNEEGATARAMGRIEAETRRMTHLVEDLLLLARLDGDQQSLDRERVELRTLVEDAAGDARAIDPNHPISVDGPDALFVSADHEQITQVVANLLTNAREHTPPGTPVEIEIIEHLSEVEIAVRDHGPGIPADAVASVFDRFYRADSSRSRKSGGAGLGLAIVDAIARAHGGRAEAANAPTGGARLAVVLPRTLGQVSGQRGVGSQEGS